jgi:hypothetical protein
MSKSNYYIRSSRYGSRKRMREILPTEEMKKLLPISKIRINPERDMLSIYNGDGKKAVRADYNVDDPPTTVKGLVQKLVGEFKYKEQIALQWSNLLSDELVNFEREEADLEDADDEDRKPYYLHKYKDIESVIIGDQPFFIQMKEGELDFNLLSEYPISDRILKPRKLHSYLSPTCSYNFESEEEISRYLKLASEKSANLNFDRIFKLVRTIW